MSYARDRYFLLRPDNRDFLRKETARPLFNETGWGVIGALVIILFISLVELFKSDKEFCVM